MQWKIKSLKIALKLNIQVLPFIEKICYRTLANKQFELNFREFFFEYMLIDFNIQSITLLSHYRRYLYSTDSYLYFITI